MAREAEKLNQIKNEFKTRTEFNKLHTMDKCAVECKICMEKVASVVLVPCNHFILCVECYLEI